MTSIDLGIARLRSAAHRMSYGMGRFNLWFKRIMPKGLYARALLIIIAPMVITLGIRRVKPSVYFKPIAQTISSRPATRRKIQSIPACACCWGRTRL